MLSSKRPNSGKVILPLLVAALSQLLCLAQTGPVYADERIGFGTVTKASLYPSYVALSDKYGEFVCGGTLLSSTVVLTAAHCLGGITQVSGGDLTLDCTFPLSRSLSPPAPAPAPPARASRSLRSVVLAAKYTVTGGKTVKIKKKVGHPGYSAKKLTDDIAVGIELDRRGLLARASPRALTRAPFVPQILFLRNSLPYKPAKLATSLPKSGKFVTIVGHGETNKKGAVPAKLEKAEMKVREPGYCNIGKKERGMMCLEAMKVKGGYNEACQGDSGGPAYSSKGVVVGVTSFGEDRKCGLNPWTVYSDVPYFTKWIKQVIASGGKGGKEVEEDEDYDYDYDDYDYEEEEEEEEEEEGDYDDYDYDYDYD